MPFGGQQHHQQGKGESICLHDMHAAVEGMTVVLMFLDPICRTNLLLLTFHSYLSISSLSSVVLHLVAHSALLI